MKQHKIIGNITDYSLREFIGFVDDNSKAKMLEILLYSSGGSAEATFGIYDYMKLSKKKFIVTGIGRVESAALVIMAAGDKKQAYENTIFMYHEPQLERRNVMIFNPHKKKLSICVEKYQSLIPVKVKKKEIYLTAEEAKKIGLIDTIL